MQNKRSCINYYVSYKLPWSSYPVEILLLEIRISINVILSYNSKNVKMHSLSVSHTVWQTPLVLAPSIGSWANENGDLWFLFCPQREAKAFSHGKDTQRQEHTTYQMIEAVRPDAGHLTKTNKLNVELSEASAGLADTHDD